LRHDAGGRRRGGGKRGLSRNPRLRRRLCRADPQHALHRPNVLRLLRPAHPWPAPERHRGGPRRPARGRSRLRSQASAGLRARRPAAGAGECLSGARQPGRHHDARIGGGVADRGRRSHPCRRFHPVAQFPRLRDLSGDHGRLSGARGAHAAPARPLRAPPAGGSGRVMEFTLWDLIRNLLLAARWTLLLSAIAFAGGGLGGLFLLVLRVSRSASARSAVKLYIMATQGTPLLLQLFLVFFGLPLLGFDVSAWLAATVALSLYASAYLVEIWRGCVDAVPRGQWDASASLGMHYLTQLRLVILPQALRMAVPPTVGFLVQLVKSTALASIIGYNELTRTGQIMTNATFRPFAIYALVALIYFAMCYPLTSYARSLERRLGSA